jgi:hypothetical protein
LVTGVAIIGYIRVSFRPPSTPIASAYFYLLFLSAIWLTVNLVRTAYVEQLASYYIKLETIAAPFVEDAEIKKYRAEYIQTESREQYLSHVKRLQAVIRSNGADPPTREFF